MKLPVRKVARRHTARGVTALGTTVRHSRVVEMQLHFVRSRRLYPVTLRTFPSKKLLSKRHSTRFILSDGPSSSYFWPCALRWRIAIDLEPPASFLSAHHPPSARVQAHIYPESLVETEKSCLTAERASPKNSRRDVCCRLTELNFDCVVFATLVRGQNAIAFSKPGE